MDKGGRKIGALKISLSCLMGLAGLYVTCLVFSLAPDPTVFTSFAAAVGVVTGSFNWANSKEHGS